MFFNPAGVSAAETGQPSDNARQMPFASAHLSQILKLDKVQRQGLAECVEALQQTIRFSGSDTRREHSAVMPNEAFDRLPATDSSDDRSPQAKDMLTRFIDWFATLDDTQRQRFQDFLRKRHGAV